MRTTGHKSHFHSKDTKKKTSQNYVHASLLQPLSLRSTSSLPFFPFNCTCYCHIVHAAWTVRYDTLSRTYCRKPSQRFYRRQICGRLCSVVHHGYGWAHVCMCDGYVCVCVATLSHDTSLAPEQRRSQKIHACDRIFSSLYTLSSPFQMKIHYCVIVKFSVCRRRHTREKERKNGGDVAQTTRLAIFKCRIKDESFACALSLSPYIFSTFSSLRWRICFRLGISYFCFAWALCLAQPSWK